MKAESRNLLILYCLKSMEFCIHASKTMTPISDQSESMQDIYGGFSGIFSSLAKDFKIIAEIMGTDLSTKKRKMILEKINKMPI